MSTFQAASAIYSIGHSTHPIEDFVGLLKRHAITTVCDVRSQPYSRLNPQFNREFLVDSLRSRGIAYVFLGRELGARSEDPSCYSQGRIQYELLAKTALFQAGLRQVLDRALASRVVLMCAERDPLECHRTILVARHLAELNLRVDHILADGQLEEHALAIERLLGRLRLQAADMFRTAEETILEAYRAQGQRIAYEGSPSNPAGDATEAVSE